MAIIVRDWRSALTDTEGDDTSFLAYCDYLQENGEIELDEILRQWINDRINVRTLSDATDVDDSFHQKLRLYNSRSEFSEVPNNVEHKRNQCYLSGRIGGCYTSLEATPAFLRQHPNFLSDQPFRSLYLTGDYRTTKADFADVLTNWRINKIWHLRISHYTWMTTEMNLVDIFRAMKPLSCCCSLWIQGVRDVQFKLSSTLIGLKKIPAKCKLRLGHKQVQ
jgi:hypothetical protein